MEHNCATDDRKLAIDRPCSACSAGDSKMEHHDHCPPFREGTHAPQAEREEANKWSDCEPKPEPREMTQTEYEVEYAKLCEKYRELLKFKVGAAPAETAPISSQTASTSWSLLGGETAGEMTAEQLAVDICRELYDRFVMGGWQPEEAHDYVRDILDVHAKQRVEQVERLLRERNLSYRAMADSEFEMRRKVADLERERDRFGATIVKLDKALEFRQREAKSAESELREMRRYLDHDPTCPEFNQRANRHNGGAAQDTAFPCNCGLARLLARKAGS